MASAAFEEIVEDFEFLDDWEDRYRHVIDMGKAMEDLDAAFKVDANKVHGCASQVWLQFYTEDGTFRFDGDSDAMIVRGLVAARLHVGKYLNHLGPMGLGIFNINRGHVPMGHRQIPPPLGIARVLLGQGAGNPQPLLIGGQRGGNIPLRHMHIADFF